MTNNTSKKTAVIIVNMGGPESLDDVKPYLNKIFMDPYIIGAPWLIRYFLAKRIAAKRAPKSKKIYEQIGGSSPIREISKEQAKLLEQRLNLNQTSSNYTVYSAMSFWHDFIEDVFAKIAEQNFEEIIVLPMYPYYSWGTVESIKSKTIRLANKHKLDNVKCIESWYNNPLYIKAVSAQIAKTHLENPEYKDILFTPHSIPKSYITSKDDPYQKQIIESIDLIKLELVEEHKISTDKLKTHLSYQSKIGPVEWLGPSTDSTIGKLAKSGLKNLMVYPLGFVADNSETLYEIEIQYAQQAKSEGIENFIAIKPLNYNETFIKCLADVLKSGV